MPTKAVGQRQLGNEASTSSGAPAQAQRTRFANLAGSIAEDLLLALLVGVFVWRGFLPAWRSLNTNFPNYYLVANLYREGSSLNQIYDWTWTQRQKDHASIDETIGAFAMLTPFSLMPVLPLSSWPPLAAKRGWLLLNLVLLALVGYLLHRMTKLGARRVALLMFLAVVPLRSNFLLGQEYVLLLFLFTLAAWLYFRERPIESGLILAVGGALKIYPALFLIFFLRKRQWRAAAGLSVGSIALWLLSAALFGVETVRTYLVEILPWALRGEGMDPYNPGWNSFSAVLHRLFIFEPELNPHPVAHLPALYCVLHPICQATIFVPFLWLMGSSRGSPEREKLHWGAFVAMLLVLSTAPASYDFNGLILTAVLATSYLVVGGRKREAAVIVILYALVCFPLPHMLQGSPDGWKMLLAVPRLWAMTALWICLMLVSMRSTAEMPRARLKRTEIVVLLTLWMALVVGATTLNIRHTRGEFENYKTRLFAAPESILVVDPVIAEDKVWFTMMTSDGFHTGNFDGRRLSLISLAADSFHPTIALNSSMALVELTSAHSRIVRFPVAVSAPGPEMISAEAEDAEKPSVSSDGRWLAFIRESKGRGSLWVKALDPGAGGEPKREAERQLSEKQLDVMEAVFDGTNNIVFSARSSGGQPALFHTRPEHACVLEENVLAPRRYPAVSPDGRWLSFSERDRGNWQLWVRDLATHEERRLTDSECNSIESAWYPDSKHIVYATDCGRGYGLTALCRIQVVP